MLADCQETLSDSRILVEEKGRKATFSNPERRQYIKTQIDGCMITNSIASDWIVGCSGIGDVIIELKGKNVNHAVEQIKATAAYWVKNYYKAPKLAAIIVCREYPRVSTKVQRAKNELARVYQAPLHVFTRNREFKIEEILSFRELS